MTLIFTMYIRFVLPLFERRYGGEAGFFHEAYEIRDSEDRAPDWLRKELREQLSWFNEHLPAPGRIERRFKRRRTIHGLCWFQPSAAECIQRARYSGWLMTEAGAPVREIRSRNPGEVMWRDDYQLVAKAPCDLPRAFC